MNQVVILGAGKSGRGFIPRFLKDCEITFADIDSALMEKLNKNKTYSIRFYDPDREEIKVVLKEALVTNTEACRRCLHDCDLLAVSIDASYYSSVYEELKAVLETRVKPLLIVTFENAINAGETLKELIGSEASKKTTFLDAGVFCTTNSEGTDIVSQNLDYLPIKKNPELNRYFKGYTAIEDFAGLMERKIYTYNCLSAVIAYQGYVRGYKWLSEAAADSSIKEAMKVLSEDLDPILAKRYHVSLEEQKEFSQSAISKFSDPFLEDSIERNVRKAVRKLSPQERLLKPLKLVSDSMSRQVLFTTIACACLYDQNQESGQGLDLLKDCDLGEEWLEVIRKLYLIESKRLHQHCS